MAIPKLNKREVIRLREISNRHCTNRRFAPKTTDRLLELGLVELLPTTLNGFALTRVTDAGRDAIKVAESKA